MTSRCRTLSPQWEHRSHTILAYTVYWATPTRFNFSCAVGSRPMPGPRRFKHPYFPALILTEGTSQVTRRARRLGCGTAICRFCSLAVISDYPFMCQLRCNQARGVRHLVVFLLFEVLFGRRSNINAKRQGPKSILHLYHTNVHHSEVHP